MRRFHLAIEEEKCWGCMTCELACKQENEVPDGQKLIRVSEDGPRQVDGRWHYLFRVNRCRHCDAPPCAEVCPVGAITAREDGIVVLSRSECTGCGSCIEACPYGAIGLDEAENTARKCNLCHHRVDQGLLPACADNICLAHCIRFTWTESPPRMIPPPAPRRRCEEDARLPAEATRADAPKRPKDPKDQKDLKDQRDLKDECPNGL